MLYTDNIFEEKNQDGIHLSINKVDAELEYGLFEGKSNCKILNIRRCLLQQFFIVCHN